MPLRPLWPSPIGLIPSLTLPRGKRWHPICESESKSRAIALAKQNLDPLQSGQSRPKIDESVLTISEPKRIRSKEHLRFVAQQPCLICGRTPAHAHHVRFAQSRGLALKVSDEFTVPLCAIHHGENYTTGDERRWWQERKIDPLVVAQELWGRSQSRGASTVEHAE